MWIFVTYVGVSLGCGARLGGEESQFNSVQCSGHQPSTGGNSSWADEGHSRSGLRCQADHQTGRSAKTPTILPSSARFSILHPQLNTWTSAQQNPAKTTQQRRHPKEGIGWDYIINCPMNLQQLPYDFKLQPNYFIQFLSCLKCLLMHYRFSQLQIYPLIAL